MDSEYSNFAEREFQVHFPPEVNDKIQLSMDRNMPVVFGCFNFQEFMLLGCNAVAGAEEHSVLKEIKQIRNDYALLHDFVPIAYKTLSYFPALLCLKVENGKCANEVFFFQGFELKPTFFVETKLMVAELLAGEALLSSDGNYLKIERPIKDVRDYFSKSIVVSGYGEDMSNVIAELNGILNSVERLTISGKKILLDGSEIYEYPYREDEFIPDSFFKLLEKLLPGYYWFQVFINWDLEHWGFGKLNDPEAADELYRNGYRKFDIG